MWETYIDEFNIAGKIIFSPLWAVGSLCLIPFAIGEFVALDIWLVLFSKNMTFDDLFDLWRWGC
jgi:hypothetical protein